MLTQRQRPDPSDRPAYLWHCTEEMAQRVAHILLHNPDATITRQLEGMRSLAREYLQVLEQEHKHVT